MNMLIAEDDAPLANVLKSALEREGHTVSVANDGQRALAMLEGGQFDLMLLDLKLPCVDGLEVLRRLESHQASTRVLVVSGRAEVEERVRALDLGADDFVPKPFSLMELTARVRAAARRCGVPNTTIHVADLVIDRLKGCAERGGATIPLTSTEFALLECLASNKGRPVSRTTILNEVWSGSGEKASNIVDVYINYLRRKLNLPGMPKLVHTVRGVGYSLGEKEPDVLAGYRLPAGQGRLDLNRMAAFGNEPQGALPA